MSAGQGDVVVVGGGAIGSAVAYFLAVAPEFAGARVVVIERDPTYRQASSALSASSIRQQFSTPENIRISQFGIDFLRRAAEHLPVEGDLPPALALHERGYLFLATADGLPTLERNHKVQAAHGVAAALLDPAGLRQRFPWLATGDLAAGSLGLDGEGWFDGYALLQAFRRKARSLGAVFLADEAVGFDMADGRVAAVRLASGERLACGMVVNAAGPWARRVAGFAGIDLPVRARRRCVFVFDCKSPVPGCPLVIDPSGVWFRPEGELYLCGASPDEADDPDDLPLEVDHALFEDVLWPALATRVPAFEAIKPVNAWAGYYEYNTFDQNGVVGRHPEVTNLIFANGFSGHGIQQSPAVGRAVAEMVLFGGYRTLDLGAFAFDRIARGRPVRELSVV